MCIRYIPDLGQLSIKIEYSSPVARAQKATQLQNVTRLLETFVPLVNLKEDLVDKFDADAYFDWAHDLLDAPESIKTDQKEIDTIREGRKQAQAEASQGEQMQGLASTGLDAAKAQSLLNPE